MSLRLGDIAPDFTQASSEGKINFYEWAGKSWVVLFSHPADFTPVCKTELGATANQKSEFEKRGVKVLALSVDTAESHTTRVGYRTSTKHKTPRSIFRILADHDREVATVVRHDPPEFPGQFDGPGRFSSSTGTRKSAPLITYPASTGPGNFVEILRVIDSLQLTDKFTRCRYPW